MVSYNSCGARSADPPRRSSRTCSRRPHALTPDVRLRLVALDLQQWRERSRRRSPDDGPLKAVIGLQISALDLGRKLAFKSYSGPITWKGEYNLADDGNGATTVSQKGILKFNGHVAPRQPLAGGQIKRGEVRELQRLKKVIEATPMGATPATA